MAAAVASSMSAPSAAVAFIVPQPPPDPNSFSTYASGSAPLTVSPITIVEVLAVAFIAIAFMHLVTR